MPERGIAEVPFALLPSPDGRPLTEQASIWIARGMIDLTLAQDALQPFDMTGKADWATTEDRFTFDAPLVIGNPLFGQDSHMSLPQLPGAQAESIAISSIMGTKPLDGPEATKVNVLARAPLADVIFIATHGVAFTDDPMSSFLALAGAPKPEGRWTAKEIQSLNLRKTDIAVLSACQTGLGQAHPGGVIGVGRAFAVAGVRWVVTSLWNVDDLATRTLMENFIGAIASCRTVQTCEPGVALQAAMAKTRAAYPDPRLWGAFVIFGVPSGSRLPHLQLQ